MRRFLPVLVLLALVASGAACVSHMVAMPGRSFSATATSAPPAPDAELAKELEAVVTHLSVEVGERNVSNFPQRLQESADWLRAALIAAGYEVTSQRFEVHGVQVENLVAEQQGHTRPGQIVVVGGHYDSAPGTPGADDNASGVAVTLALARRFAHRQTSRTLRFMFFTNEEPPWFNTANMGSAHAAALAKEQHEDVAAVLSLETMGFASGAPKSQHSPWPLSVVSPDTGNFIAFVGNTAARPLTEACVRAFREVAQVPSEGVAAPDFVQGIDWSDHGPFARAGYQALMVTDTAPYRNPNYHGASDLPTTMDFGFLALVTTGLEHVVLHLAE